MYYPPDGGEERFEIEADRSFRLGAKDDNDVVISQQDVSRHHAILRVNAGTLHITDLKSKNGTFINGNRTDSAQFRAGDLVNLSSARLVVVELDGSETPISGVALAPSGEHSSATTSDTVGHRIHPPGEELIKLLEITAGAVRWGGLAEPLNWGVKYLGLLAALVLYVDEDGRVSVVSSAGDLGPMISNSDDLRAMARDSQVSSESQSRIRRFHNVGEDLLIAPLMTSYLMVVRYSESAPDAGEILALASAVEIVLLTEQCGDSAGVPRPEDQQRSPLGLAAGQGFWESLLQYPLREARLRFERWFVARVLGDCDWNQSEAARRLGVSRAGLFKKVRKLGINNPGE